MSKWRDSSAASSAPSNVGARSCSPAGSTRAATTAGSSSSISATRRRHPARRQPGARTAAAAAAHELRNEFVVRLAARSSRARPELVNPNLPTGEIEVQVDELEIVSRSTPLPFQLDEENVDDNVRMRYRWLDLRRAEAAAQHPPPRADGRRDPAGHGGGRLRRHPDADPLEADTGGRARLPRPVAPAAGPLLRTAAVAADREAAARDQRASSATTRSRSASATRISAPTACRRSRSSTSRWRSRTWSSCFG